MEQILGCFYLGQSHAGDLLGASSYFIPDLENPVVCIKNKSKPVRLQNKLGK